MKINLIDSLFLIKILHKNTPKNPHKNILKYIVKYYKNSPQILPANPTQKYTISLCIFCLLILMLILNIIYVYAGFYSSLQK